MGDLISRSQAMEDVGSLTMTITGLRAGKGVLKTCLEEYRKSVLKILDEQPPIEAKPVVHGEWIDTQPGYNNGCYKNAHMCSACQNYFTKDYDEMNFCPNCGADMRKKVNE